MRLQKERGLTWRMICISVKIRFIRRNTRNLGSDGYDNKKINRK